MATLAQLLEDHFVSQQRYETAKRDLIFLRMASDQKYQELVEAARLQGCAQAALTVEINGRHYTLAASAFEGFVMIQEQENQHVVTHARTG